MLGTSHEYVEDYHKFIARPSFARHPTQVCELVQMLSSLMRQSVPPAGLYRTLENASLACEETGRGRRASKLKSPSAGKSTLTNM